MKRNHLLISLLLIPALAWYSCGEDWFDVQSKGILDQHVMATESGIDGMLIGAYSMLDGVGSGFSWESASSNWLYGSIRGLEGNKGTDAGDSYSFHGIMRFDEIPYEPYLDVKWQQVYEAISRCNLAIMLTNLALEKGTITNDQAVLFYKQARVLRGWYHFEAWRMWEMVPYFDENTDAEHFTNTVDIRDKIIADLQEGITLPDNMGQVGRFNSTVSKVLLAKALIQLYHNYTDALSLLQEVKTGGTKPNGEPIGLALTYGEVFDIENRNGIESVYTVQYSVNDGSGGWNGGWGEVLNFPYKSGASPGGVLRVLPAHAGTGEFLPDIGRIAFARLYLQQRSGDQRPGVGTC